MKNKIIINILVAYFLILSTVLLIQISSKKTNAVEPLSNNITSEDKLKNSVVLAINSPVIIVNEKQYLIDEKDTSLVPITENGKVYIPIKLLQTAFGANINFYKDTKQTIVRLNNKAILFKNNGTSIQVIDNTSEETLNIDEKAKIINDRFYIPLRSFADIFKKEVFYNDDLMIISNIENLFDPIEELDILQELEKQVKQLPIIGNIENLKHLTKEKKQSLSFKSNLINIENLDNLLKENKPVIIKKTNNYNIYATEGFIEVYFVKEKSEVFSFKIEKENNNIKDIQITDDRFIVSYETDNSKTFIYDISNRENIKTLKVIENNGNFYQNIIQENNLYSISKINVYDNKNKLPYFCDYVYKDNSLEKIKEKTLNLNEIFYFPDLNDNNYTLISYVNLYNVDNFSTNNVYLGMGDNIIFNENDIYIATSNKENNNLYQFKSTLDGIKYTQRVFVKGYIKSLELDKEKQFIRVNLQDREIFFDNNLTKRIDKEV